VIFKGNLFLELITIMGKIFAGVFKLAGFCTRALKKRQGNTISKFEIKKLFFYIFLSTASLNNLIIRR